MAENEVPETPNQSEDYEEPSLLDLEDVAGGAAAEGACNTSGSGHLCTGGCNTSGSSILADELNTKT